MYFTFCYDSLLQGDSGQNNLTGGMTADNAIKAFGKKFQDKTKNKWDNHDNFEAKSGKYTLIEMGDEEEEEDLAKLDVWLMYF